ncbi:MAG: hypothetical protein JW958_07920 [Candidatus Eisenbacteria bacterium]|nr:hypothetical protein [Candidatus Eisenbacteria bacterium]
MKRHRLDPEARGGVLPNRAARTGAILFSMLFLLLVPPSLHAEGPQGHAPTDFGRDTGDALLLLRVDSIDELWSFVEEWEREGAWFPNVYPPDLLIGDVPALIESDLRADPRVEALHRKPARPAPGKQARRWADVIESWNRELLPRENPGAGKAGAEEFEDILLPPVEIPAEAHAAWSKVQGDKVYGRAFGANIFQTSEILMEKVAVATILLDSDGGSFSDGEIIPIHENVRAACDFWAHTYAGPGVRFVHRFYNNVPVSRNFHQLHPMYKEEDWVEEAMLALGYTGQGLGKFLNVPIPNAGVYELLDSLRTKFQSEWGVVFFIVKEVNGLGPGYTAYAHLGGPFLVVPSGYNGTISNRPYSLAHLIIHESAHTFWALDEYRSGGTSTPCHVRSGYHGVMNLNSLNRDYTCMNITPVPCCMNVPTDATCKYTLGQMGVWDADTNGIWDILDTRPRIVVDGIPDTITTVFPNITGIAAVSPRVNQANASGLPMGDLGKTLGRNNITFNTIHHVIYRVDDMLYSERDGDDIVYHELWMYADPEGGWGGDSTRVHFNFVPDSLTGGMHTLTIRAVNSQGLPSIGGAQYRDSIFVKAIALHDFIAEPDFEGKVSISYRIRGGTFGAQGKLYRRDSAGNETMIDQFPLESDSRKTIVDEGTRPGERYVYRLEGSALGISWNWTSGVNAPAPIAKNEHLSRITPNPFSPRKHPDGAIISFHVPKGPLNARYSGGSGKPGDNEIWTPPTASYAPAGSMVSGKYSQLAVHVDIYNIAGRRVRHFPTVHSYEGIYDDQAREFLWMGEDDSGRRLPAGIYLVRMSTGDDVTETRKVVLLP